MRLLPPILFSFTLVIGFPLSGKTTTQSTAENTSSPTPITLTEDGFTFQYPSNWTRNDKEKAPDDPTNTIILDCPQNSYLKFFIIDGIKLDAEEKLQDILQSYVTAINPYTQKKIRRWGNFYGHGIQIEGKVMNTFPGGIRIFVSEAIGDKHFIVTEFYYAEDIQAYLTGMEMIQETLKKAP